MHILPPSDQNDVLKLVIVKRALTNVEEKSTYVLTRGRERNQMEAKIYTPDIWFKPVWIVK